MFFLLTANQPSVFSGGKIHSKTNNVPNQFHKLSTNEKCHRVWAALLLPFFHIGRARNMWRDCIMLRVHTHTHTDIYGNALKYFGIEKGLLWYTKIIFFSLRLLPARLFIWIIIWWYSEWGWRSWSPSRPSRMKIKEHHRQPSLWRGFETAPQSYMRKGTGSTCKLLIFFFFF